jgi:hypothetical protein
LYVACRARDTHGRYEAQCYPTRRGGKHFRGSSSRLCKAILMACGSDNQAALTCGEAITDERGRTLLPIITRLNLSKA